MGGGPDQIENTKLSITVHKGEDILLWHKSQKALDLTSPFKEVLRGKSCGENDIKLLWTSAEGQTCIQMEEI